MYGSAIIAPPESVIEHLRNALAIGAALRFQLELGESVTAAELLRLEARVLSALELLEGPPC